MSKAVLISIRPEWCEKIVDGAKTIEVRKTRPKLEPPFKCYIYCAYGKGLIERYDQCSPNVLIEQKVSKGATWGNCCNGKVIGEFVCDWIDVFMLEAGPIAELSLGSLVTPRELYKYAGSYMGLYGWHISDLVIYDEPKELSVFEKPCKCMGEYEGESYCDCLNCEDAGDSDYGIIACDRKLKRPPQSWSYVEPIT